MQTYRTFRPTGFDSQGLGAERLGVGEWLVLPCSQTRDSGILERSNFTSALQQLGGESDDVEVHRFGHWGPGWFELILVRPGTGAATTAEEIADALEDYPVVNEEHHDIKDRTKDTSPYFFSRDSLRFFGQTMRSFSVRIQPDGRYRIAANMRNRDGRIVGATVRFFNPATNHLDRE